MAEGQILVFAQHSDHSKDEAGPKATTVAGSYGPLRNIQFVDSRPLPTILVLRLLGVGWRGNLQVNMLRDG